MFNVDLQTRASNYLALVKLAPAGPGPAHSKALALAELLALTRPAEDPMLTPAVILLIAEAVESFAALACGRHGYAVFDVPSLVRLMGTREAALTVIRLAGGHCGADGNWIDCDGTPGTEPVLVVFPPDFLGTVFKELAVYFQGPCSDADE